MKKDVPIEVQKAKIAKARAKRASRRNAKRGVTNSFKNALIHNLPYGLDKVKNVVIGAQFAKVFQLGGRSYVQAVEVVNMVLKSEDGRYFRTQEEAYEAGVEVLAVPVTAAKTAVRI